MTSTPTKSFPNGSTPMAYIGLGTFRCDKPEELKQAVKEACRAGYRHFDCAYSYLNEEVVGEALKECYAELNLSRKDFFITSKCWITFLEDDRPKLCLEKTLKKSGFEYLDLYLIHFPGALTTTNDDDLLPKDKDGNMTYSDLHYLDAYKKMEALVSSGKVLNIGISNFNCAQTQDVLNNCKIKPASNQFECNPYCRNDELVKLCQANGIVPVAYGPFGGSPTPGVAGTKILEDNYLNELAKKHDRSVGQIILRWLYQRDIVSIPKSTNPKRLKDNLNVFDFELSQQEMDGFNKLPKVRTFNFDHAFFNMTKHKFYPHTEPL